MPSDNTVDDGSNGRLPRTRSLERYDVLLAGIPLAFLLAVALSQVLSLSLQVSVTSASLLSMVGLVDAMFLTPPR